MLADWERSAPGRVETIFKAMGNIAPSQLADRALFDFAGLRADGLIGEATKGWLVPPAEQA